MKRFDKQPGFTLIEVAISIVLLAIITTLAVPSMNTLLDKRYVRNAAKDFEEILRLGSIEARTRLIQTNTGQRVTLCPYNENRDACMPIAPASLTGVSSPWRNNGWVLFIDVDMDNDLGNADTVLNSNTENASQNFLLSFNANPSSNRIAFGNRGPIETSAYAPITFSNTDNSFQYEVAIDFRTGQTQRTQL